MIFFEAFFTEGYDRLSISAIRKEGVWTDGSIFAIFIFF